METTGEHHGNDNPRPDRLARQVPIDRRHFARVLRRLRQQWGLSGGEAARRIGVSERTWRAWENAERDVRLDNIRTVADAFDLTVEELAGTKPVDSISRRLAELEAQVREIRRLILDLPRALREQPPSETPPGADTAPPPDA